MCFQYPLAKVLLMFYSKLLRPIMGDKSSDETCFVSTLYSYGTNDSFNELSQVCLSYIDFCFYRVEYTTNVAVKHKTANCSQEVTTRLIR